MLDLDASDTVLDAKLALQKETGIPPHQQRLLYSGKVLDYDRHILDEYNISANSTLHFVPKVEKSFPESQHKFATSTARPTWTTEYPIPSPSFIKENSNAFGRPTHSQAYGNQQKEATHATGYDLPTSTGAGDNFDDDEYILDPRAHFQKLKVLEKQVVEGSEFYHFQGIYGPPTSRAFKGEQSKKISNIPNHLRISLENISWIPATPELRTTVNRPVKKFEDWWQQERRNLAYLCQSYFIICRVLQSLAILQESRFCSSNFNFLRLHEGKHVAELVRLRISLIESIKVGIEAAIEQILDDIGVGSSQAFLQEYVEVPCAVLMKDVGIMPLKPGSRNGHSILTFCRKTAWFLDLALVSYVGSHGSWFAGKYIRREQRKFEIRGDSEDDFTFTCSMQPLACLHGFLDQREAWVFRFHPGQQLPILPHTTASLQLSVLTRIEDFADIWGPVWTIPSESGQIKQFNVSKGVICRVRSGQNDFGAIQCHWYSRTSYHRRRVSTLLSRSEDLLLNENDLLLIGAVFRQNQNCGYTLDDYEADYGSNMGVLGTTPSYWKQDSRGLSLGLSKIVGVTVSGSQKLIPQTSVKQHILDKWTNNPTRANPGVLNQYLGVEISNCTGNARRISLKHLLLLRVVSPLLERQIPGWTRTRWGSSFLAALRSTNPQAIFNVWRDFLQHRPRMAELACCVLEVLNTTGRSNDLFLAGFLHDNQECSVSLDYGRNEWAEILEDTHLTGAYAIINEVCLECQLPNHKAMTCANSDAYTVLQTQFKIDAGDRDAEIDRITISPHGKMYRRADAGSHRILLFEPASRSFGMLSRFSALEASEARDHDNNNPSFHLRASSRSYHGRKAPRRRPIVPARRVVVTRHHTNELERVAIRDADNERLPVLQGDNAPPAVHRHRNDNDRRRRRHDRPRAHSRIRRTEQDIEDCESAEGADDLLHDIRNYAIEDDVSDTAIWYDNAHPDPLDEHRRRHVIRPRINDEALGQRGYERRVR